jgi:predicted DCC family thiol-disulfide oxidoreductase YuxK
VSKNEGIVVVYDGECPFCSSYVRLLNLRKSVGSVKLVNARSDDPIVMELKRRNANLNEGMAVILGDETYLGEDAVVVLSALSGAGSFLGTIFASLLRSPLRARILYPWMKAGRRMTLKILGKQQIMNF